MQIGLGIFLAMVDRLAIKFDPSMLFDDGETGASIDVGGTEIPDFNPSDIYAGLETGASIDVGGSEINA